MNVIAGQQGASQLAQRRKAVRPLNSPYSRHEECAPPRQTAKQPRGARVNLHRVKDRPPVARPQNRVRATALAHADAQDLLVFSRANTHLGNTAPTSPCQWLGEYTVRGEAALLILPDTRECDEVALLARRNGGAPELSGGNAPSPFLDVRFCGGEVLLPHVAMPADKHVVDVCDNVPDP